MEALAALWAEGGGDPEAAERERAQMGYELKTRLLVRFASGEEDDTSISETARLCIGDGAVGM